MIDVVIRILVQDFRRNYIILVVICKGCLMQITCLPHTSNITHARRSRVCLRVLGTGVECWDGDMMCVLDTNICPCIYTSELFHVSLILPATVLRLNDNEYRWSGVDTENKRTSIGKFLFLSVSAVLSLRSDHFSSVWRRHDYFIIETEQVSLAVKVLWRLGVHKEPFNLITLLSVSSYGGE